MMIPLFELVEAYRIEQGRNMWKDIYEEEKRRMERSDKG